MSKTISAEATTSLALADADQPIRDLVIGGKPLSLARSIMGAANDVELRTKLITEAIHATAVALETEIITDTRANLNMRNIAALDDSEDHQTLCEALSRLEESNPTECKAVICSLSATTMLSLAQPDTKLAALIVENVTPKQLASMANSIAGKVYISETRQREADRKRDLMGTNNQPPRISDDPELNHFRQKAIRRQLGQLLDLITEAGDESLEKFALAITKYQSEPDEPHSTLFNAIYQLALEDSRESAIELIQVLPETPRTTMIKARLGLE